jgi:DNA-binding MarR family transcriptional regulator
MNTTVAAPCTAPHVTDETHHEAALVGSQGCTNLKLRQLMRRVGKHYDAEVGKTGLKGTQYSLLSYICKLGPLRPVDLTRAAGLDSSTLSRNLRPLIDAGWVSLGAGPDARSRLVSATEAGLAKRTEAQHHWGVAQEALNLLLGPAQVVALHSLIDHSLDALNAINAPNALFTETPL